MNENNIKKILIMLIIFAIMWLVYKQYVTNVSTTIMDIPHSIKCFFNESGCEEGNLDYLSIVHFLVYFIIGMLFPNHYVIIIIISICYELMVSYLNGHPKYIINPLINFTGYALGSLFALNKNDYDKKYKVYLS